MVEHSMTIGGKQAITGVVDFYAWNGTNIYENLRAGAYGPFQPTSNGGPVRVLTADGPITLFLGGPGVVHSAGISVDIDQFFKRAISIFKSYCYGTKVLVEYVQLPTESFARITLVDGY